VKESVEIIKAVAVVAQKEYAIKCTLDQMDIEIEALIL